MNNVQLSNPQNGRVDLHLHTRNSDGDDTLSDVIRMAAEEGLKVIAVTDHNKFSLEQCRNEGELNVIPGCEFSTAYLAPAREETVEVHVVGLFPEGVNPEDFNGIFQNIQSGKKSYVDAILQQLESIGLHISLAEVEAVRRPGRHMGRHDIAEVLIRRGYAKDMDDAFDRYIGDFSPYYVPSTRFIGYASMEQVVQQIINSGGIPVLAHPWGYGIGEQEIRQLISDFKSVSGELGGLEVYYELYLDDPEKMNFLRCMALEYDLLPSAASDRHRAPQPFASTNGLAMYQKMLAKLNQCKNG